MASNYLYHHGILGQKWGKRNGPPYPLGGGQYTRSELVAVFNKRKASPHGIYNKRHFDEVLKKDSTTLSTLSYDKNRTKDADMFYATHKKLDKHQYNALFNKKIKEDIKDKNGNVIGSDEHYKFRIDNSLKSDMKVASEDSAAKVFMDLYSKDRDFYNFVTDENRMSNYFNTSVRYKFKGYREGEKWLKNIQKGETPSTSDLQKVYRLFNYTIPYDGAGNAKNGHDMAVQRAKYFKAMKAAGYGALLDTNDAIYGGFKASSPVIVFDTSQIIQKQVYQTKLSDKAVSQLVTIGRKAVGV